nr:alanine aminotransferase 1-like [Anser cygnoides]
MGTMGTGGQWGWWGQWGPQGHGGDNGDGGTLGTVGTGGQGDNGDNGDKETGEPQGPWGQCRAWGQRGRGDVGTTGTWGRGDKGDSGDLGDRWGRVGDSQPRWPPGAYSASPGIEAIRQDVARFLERRDGVPARPQDIFLATGASDAIVSILKLLVAGEGSTRTGVLVPVPQYPLYSAALAELGAVQLGYLLAEECTWALDPAELRRVLDEGRRRCCPRALCVINPGNPTGTAPRALRALRALWAPWALQALRAPQAPRALQAPRAPRALRALRALCGFRGGYVEVVNMDPEVQQQLAKLVSVRLCPPVAGQILLDAVVNPPQPGEPSYEGFMAPP